MMFLSRKRNKKSRFKLFSGNPTSASWGTLIPTNVTRVVAGDDFSFQPGVGVQALPIVAPFMGNVCVKKEYFLFPTEFIISTVSLIFRVSLILEYCL